MSQLIMVASIIWWMLVGAAVTLSVIAARGKRIYSDMDPLNKYRYWLGRRCEVKVLHGKDKGWHACAVVAVSHKGAVAVRKLSDESGRHAFWVSKDKVGERVIWR